MKKFGKRRPTADPAWHFDFRDVETLPDVKVVRTSFFINCVAILLLMMVVLFSALQELKRSSLESDIAALEEKITDNRDRNAEALRLHREFVQEERIVSGVIEHLEGSIELSSLLVALAETLPDEMLFSTIRYQDRRGRETSGKELVIHGSISATPDDAASILTRYIGSFQENPFLAEQVKEAVPTSLVPTSEGTLMSFGIQVTFQSGEEKEEK